MRALGNTVGINPEIHSAGAAEIHFCEISEVYNARIKTNWMK